MTHLLIAGHGKQKNEVFDPGATGLIAKGENRYMKEDLFPAMKKFLPKNHDLVFFDEYNVYSHGNIVALAKKYNASQVTEFHFDAASASATGGHVIIHSDYSADKMDLALRDTIKSMVGTIYTHKGDAGISGRNDLANVNRTANAGITYRLVELGFGTNKDNAKALTDDVEKYAKELVKTLTGTTNDKKAAVTKPSASKPAASKPSKPKNKTIAQMVTEVIAEKHGQGHPARKKSLGISDAEYAKVRAEVNKRLGAPAHKNTTKTIKQMAQEVIANKHGNGHANRQRSLGLGDATYAKVRAEVNKQAGKSASKPKQSVSQMATRIINDKKAPTGHDARRKWLGVNDATYQKVRAEVNKRM